MIQIWSSVLPPNVIPEQKARSKLILQPGISPYYPSKKNKGYIEPRESKFGRSGTMGVCWYMPSIDQVLFLAVHIEITPHATRGI